MNNSTILRGNILIVDDLPDNLRLLFTLLMPQGYEVGKALNGQMALKSAYASPPDLILLDINMPHMDGYEVCCHLKTNPHTKDIPVIFISALDDVWDKVKAFKVGGVDYITKPFQAEEVLARVENQLKIRTLSKSLQQEQQKTEKLLLNILPKPIVEELKYCNTSTPIQFEAATFLFADIVKFTNHTHAMPPGDVVTLLNQIFLGFDQLVLQAGAEKIRTIGDSYFVGAGLPIKCPDHARQIASLALSMQSYIGQYRWPHTNSPIQLRIGIHTGGPVVAAVIGSLKFAYDVWGEAVNFASRLESSGEPGKIQVSAATYSILRDQYNLTKRGVIDIKGFQEVTTYWLNS